MGNLKEIDESFSWETAFFSLRNSLRESEKTEKTVSEESYTGLDILSSLSIPIDKYIKELKLKKFKNDRKLRERARIEKIFKKLQETVFLIFIYTIRRNNNPSISLRHIQSQFFTYYIYRIYSNSEEPAPEAL